MPNTALGKGAAHELAEGVRCGLEMVSGGGGGDAHELLMGQLTSAWSPR